MSHPVLGPLAEISMRPEGIIPMSKVKFPASFSHCHAFVTEINVEFDVYSDTSGLEYWLYEEDSRWGTKGELYQVVYAPRRQRFPPNTIC